MAHSTCRIEKGKETNREVDPCQLFWGWYRNPTLKDDICVSFSLRCEVAFATIGHILKAVKWGKSLVSIFFCPRARLSKRNGILWRKIQIHWMTWLNRMLKAMCQLFSLPSFSPCNPLFDTTYEGPIVSQKATSSCFPVWISQIQNKLSFCVQNHFWRALSLDVGLLFGRSDPKASFLTWTFWERGKNLRQWSRDLSSKPDRRLQCMKRIVGWNSDSDNS